MKSTGPKTAHGKARSSANAMSHGILSASLLIDGEDPAVYEQLFQALVADLHPVGALELIHVERIATAIWRQRRLIRSESAAVRFHQVANDTRKMLNETLGVGESVRFKDHALEPLSEDELRLIGSYSAMIDELAALKPLPENLPALRARAPVYWGYLEHEAARMETHVLRFVVLASGIPEERTNEAIGSLIKTHASQFAQAFAALEQRLKVSMMRKPYQEMKAIPPEAELFARYQTALDNTLTKAIRGLREAQEIRMSMIDQGAM